MGGMFWKRTKTKHPKTLLPRLTLILRCQAIDLLMKKSGTEVNISASVKGIFGAWLAGGPRLRKN